MFEAISAIAFWRVQINIALRIKELYLSLGISWQKISSNQGRFHVKHRAMPTLSLRQHTVSWWQVIAQIKIIRFGHCACPNEMVSVCQVSALSVKPRILGER